MTDHFMPNTKEREGAMLEGWSTLTALAALVPRMQVGTIVLGNTYRHPAVVAKMAAQVDIISGGRLLLGLGAGWQENEHEAYGIPFYTMRERLERLDEACQVMKSLWTEDRSTFKGRYYTLSDAPLQPKAVQKPHPELMIGGGGEKVTLRTVARHADHWNVWGGPKVLAHKGRILDEHCGSVGRDPEDHPPLGQHGAADHRQEGRGGRARRDDRLPHGAPRRGRARHLPGRHPRADPGHAGRSCGPRRSTPCSSRPCSGPCPSCDGTWTASSRRSPPRSAEPPG